MVCTGTGSGRDCGLSVRPESVDLSAQKEGRFSWRHRAPNVERRVRSAERKRNPESERPPVQQCMAPKLGPEASP